MVSVCVCALGGFPPPPPTPQGEGELSFLCARACADYPVVSGATILCECTSVQVRMTSLWGVRTGGRV